MIADIYLETQGRLREFVASLDVAELHTPVPACPGWSVHDVLAHLTGVIEDVNGGRLAGVPTPEQTREEVERHRGEPTAALLDTWDDLAPGFADLMDQLDVWPAAIDVVTHEQDIRGALRRPGARDDAGLVECARQLVALIQVPMVLHLGDETIPVAGGGPVELTTTPFELLRFRLGRRSAAQLAAMSWAGGPPPPAQELVVFGPAEADLIE